MILSFSSSLQVRHHFPSNLAWRVDYDDTQKAALEVHDLEEKAQVKKLPIITTVGVEEPTTDPVCFFASSPVVGVLKGCVRH